MYSSPTPPPNNAGDAKGVLASLLSLWFASDKLNLTVESDTLTTIDATATTLDSFTVDDETTYHFHSTVLAVGSDNASYEIVGTFKRSGTVTQIGTTTALHTAESDAGWLVEYDISGNDVRLRVTGAASILWRSSTKVMALT